jgi:predicted nucleotidyltransferase
MDKRKALKIAREYLNFLEDKYDIRNALLFGSYAKGNYHDNSDIDIAIILNHVNDIFDTQVELLKLRRKFDLRIEPHPFNEVDFNKTNPVANEIIKYGIVINH